MKKLVLIIQGLIIALFLFVALLLCNLLQLASIVFLPVSRFLVRAINRACANYWWGLCVFCFKNIIGVKIKFYGDIVPHKENAIVIANHQSMSDIPILLALGWNRDTLGDYKWFVKDIIKYVPGVGWGMLFLDCIFLKRNWDSDEQKIKETFNKFHHYKIPLWLLIFPEGTRVTPEKLERSNNYAKIKGIPETKKVLLPRTKGFASSIVGLRGHAKAVYDITILYKGKIPSLFDLFVGGKRDVVLKVQRFPLDEAFSSSDPLSYEKWLQTKFLEKDKFLQQGPST